MGALFLEFGAYTTYYKRHLGKFSGYLPVHVFIGTLVWLQASLYSVSTIYCSMYYMQALRMPINFRDCMHLVSDFRIKPFEPVREKTSNLGFQPGPTQTSLCSHRKKLEA